MADKIDKLYSKTLCIVEREVEHLRILAIGGKLNPAYALDLSRYVKLLDEMKKAKEKALKAAKERASKSVKDIPDEALLEQVKAAPDKV